MQVPTLAIKDMEQIVSLAACSTMELHKNMPVKFSANMIRVNRTCTNRGVDYQRCLECHAKKEDTLLMIVHTGAEINVVCERHRK